MRISMVAITCIRSLLDTKILSYRLFSNPTKSINIVSFKLDALNHAQRPPQYASPIPITSIQSTFQANNP